MELLSRLAVLCALLGACYAPSLDGKFACGSDGSCPSGLRCASDGICRRQTVDAGLDTNPGPGVDLASLPVTDMAMPQPDLATCQKAVCGTDQCGDILDGCGGKVTCGKCGSMQTCGAGGAHVCGMGMCMPQSCGDQHADCGLVSDGCAKVLDCGDCDDGKQCGTDHKCH